MSLHTCVCLLVCVCLHVGLCDIKLYNNWLYLRTNVAILDITFILIIVNQIYFYIIREAVQTVGTELAKYIVRCVIYCLHKVVSE